MVRCDPPTASRLILGGVNGSTSRIYNNDFRLASRSVNGGHTVSFQYDGDGLVTRAGDLTLTRHAQHGLTVGTTLGGVTTASTFTGFGEQETFEVVFDGMEKFAAQYLYDRLGRITQKTEQVDGMPVVLEYVYDQTGRLSQVHQDNDIFSGTGRTTVSYTYDDNGNRLSRTTPGGTLTGVYDAQDRLLNYGALSYTYTPNGELLTKTDGNTGDVTEYEYDELENLMTVTLPNGPQVEYVVDGMNRRIGKKVDGTLVRGFLYKDALNPIAELDGSGAVVSRFVYGTRANVPDYVVKGGSTYRIVSDQLGSPRFVIDVTTGAIVQQMDYDEFGNVLFDSNPGFQPFGFAGGLYDQHTTLTRFGARDYDAFTGRWTVKDKILFKGGDPNLYAYVKNDPVNRLDPLGFGHIRAPARASAAEIAEAEDIWTKLQVLQEAQLHGLDGETSVWGEEVDPKVKAGLDELRREVDEILNERIFVCYWRVGGLCNKQDEADLLKEHKRMTKEYEGKDSPKDDIQISLGFDFGGRGSFISFILCPSGLVLF